MIKGRSGEDLIFGLSARNLDLLMQGKPIAVALEELGVPGMRVVIFYGRTEADMLQELRATGYAVNLT